MNQPINPQTTDKSNKKKQWLWFIGLYVVSVVAVAGVVTLIRLFIPH